MMNRLLGNRAARLALRSAVHHHVSPQTSIRVQRVAFRAPPRPVRKFFFTTSCLFLATFFWTDLLDPYIFGDEEDEHEKHGGSGVSKGNTVHGGGNKSGSQVGGEEEEEEGSDEDLVDELEGFFVAFPFTTKVHQPAPYRGTDLEWKQYIEFSKNKALQKELREELVKVVVHKIGADNKKSKLYMPEPRGVRMWLDYQYPPAPPQEFYHSGILYATDGNIYWTVRRATSKVSIDLDRIFYPQLVAQTIYQYATLSFTTMYDNFRAIYFPDTTRPQRPIIQINTLSLPPSQERKTKLVIEDGDTGDMTIVERVTRMALGHAIAITEPMKNTYKQAGLAILRKWKGYKYPPPRGAIMLTGMVEVETPHAFLLVDVSAYWQPKEKEFHLPSMSLSARGSLPKVQTPLR